MKPAQTMPVQSWMTSPETLAVMTPLNAGATEPQALFVGGCVRNTLLGVVQGDIDIATLWTPDEVTAKLAASGLKVIPTGIDHGTVTAISGGKPYEITTLRRDIETDGRRAVIAFSKDWAEDAGRRDFTMNTLLADTSGNIFDPTGQGLVDLKARRVLFVGDPSERIAEDVLRILRFFRFYALYGTGDPDPAALKACREQAHKITSLSRERITQEFTRIMSVDNSADILRIIFNNGVLREFFISDQQIDLLKKYGDKIEKKEYAVQLFILADISVDNLRKMEQRLIIPKALWREILSIDAVMVPFADEQAVKVALYRHGREATAAALGIELAKAKINQATYDHYLDLAQHWPIPVFPLSGDDLIRQGFSPGPELGSTLKRLEDKWVESGFVDSTCQ